MSHVAEGFMHAYLDGAVGPDEQLQWARAEAHFEVCDDCRRRLDEAREIRRAAGELLAGGAFASPPPRPDFASLRAAAEERRRAPDASRSRGRGGNPWWRAPARLAWAASLVMAVGAGWIGRQLLVEQGMGPPAVMTEAAPPADDRTAAGRADAARGQPRELRDEAQREEATRSEMDADVGRARDAAPVERQKTEITEAPAAPAQQPAAGARLQASPSLEPGARCYGGGEPTEERGEGGVAGLEVGAADDANELRGAPVEALLFEPDGTARGRLGGRPVVGFWEPAGDSLRVRVTDGRDWRELRLLETEDGVRGDAELASAVCL